MNWKAFFLAAATCVVLAGVVAGVDALIDLLVSMFGRRGGTIAYFVGCALFICTATGWSCRDSEAKS